MSTKMEENIIVISTEEPTPMAKWYVVHTFSGNEHKVAQTLTERVQLGGYTDKIFKVMVPQKKKIVVTMIRMTLNSTCCRFSYS